MADLVVGTDSIVLGGKVLGVGEEITLDGAGGGVVLGTPELVTAGTDDHVEQLLGWADEVSGEVSRRGGEERLEAAQAVLRRRGV
ncbi:hypothetical protein [Lentzea sp. NPDC003310]|uniref:hypothetical protein n=1 Tax=Lentzea sp. NPDC003310 TaxID=3154447 RepID=UPI0033AD4FB9